MSRISWILTALVVAIVGATARGQDASRFPGNDYQLKVIEPLEGASFPGSAVRVQVKLEFRPRVIIGAKGPTPTPRPDTTPTPKPMVEIYIDKELMGALEESEDSVVIDGLAEGSHTLLVTASDRSGTVLERKEVHFTMLPDTE
jgi:hypothetical protein